MSNLQCIDLKKRKCSICFVCMYEVKESGPCPPGNNWFFLVEELRGKRKVMEIICQVWLKIPCAQSLWRQKMTEVNSCYFIYSVYFHARRWMQEEAPLLLRGGKGSEQGGSSERTVSVGTLSTSSCQLSKGGVVFLSWLCSSVAALEFSFLWARSGIVDCGCYALL